MTTSTLQESNVILNLPTEEKHAAIKRVGQKLVDNGYVTAQYVQGMLAREKSMSTYVGNGVAIPHGLPENVENIRTSGIAVAQYPNGVDFGDGNIAYLVIGIAGRGEEHMEVLSQIAIVCQEKDNVDKLVSAKTAKEVLDVINEGGSL